MMKFCSQCGAPVIRKVPPGDNLPRFVCEACQAIHYQNPKIVAGCIPEWNGSILLCRRAIEPRSGLWTFPAGFMEIGESAEQAALRETLEEAHADVEIASLYAVFSLPHISQVYMVFRGLMRSPDFKAGAESLEVQLFAPETIPWGLLAFPVIQETLARYVRDLEQGCFMLHVGSVMPPMR
ncbi:MAG TPA: NUDIX hydrolase [Nitrospiraceae bacterium]|jgi:ADP-ribose pyrophosphatase YjhB (NUDIX family)|nr:NUDIX hydrolase [Nitrospiraceae bacterium]